MTDKKKSIFINKFNTTKGLHFIQRRLHANNRSHYIKLFKSKIDPMYTAHIFSTFNISFQIDGVSLSKICHQHIPTQ